MFVGAKRSLLKSSGLFGAGTAAGAWLGNEPNGLAVDNVNDMVLIRDATGAKNFYGTMSVKYPANQIPITDLPSFQQAVGSWLSVGTMSSVTNERMFSIASSDGNDDIYVYREASNQATYCLSVNFAAQGSNPGTGATGAYKLAGRWAFNDMASYRNGVSDTTDATANSPDDLANIRVWADRSNTNQWSGGRTAFAWVPRAMSNAELAAWST